MVPTAGFELATARLQGECSTNCQGNPDLEPETSRNKEVTLTYDQGHHRVSATAYHNKINDLLVCCQGLPNDFPVNVGNATIKGMKEGSVDAAQQSFRIDLEVLKARRTGNPVGAKGG